MTTPKAPDGHSALPWTARFNPIADEIITIRDANGDKVALLSRTVATRAGDEPHRRSQKELEALAELIVEAVNAHPTLTACIEELEGEMTFLLERLEEWSNEHLSEDGARDWLGHVEPAIARARTALENRK